MKEIAQISADRTTTLPPGGADPADPGVQEFAQIQAKVLPKQEELDKKRAEYQIKYPILFKLDPQQVAAASDKEVDAILEGPVKVVLDNIETTKGNLTSGDLKIWKLKAAGIDLPRLTKDDMGIAAGSTLDKVVDKKAADDKSTGEKVTEALNALSMVADTVALLTGPIGMAVAGGITAVAAVANVVQEYKTFAQLQAAGNVAIEPDAAKMATEQPDMEGLIFSLAMAGLAALTATGAIRQAVNEFRKAKAVAADLASFKKLINETALDPTVKERLVAEAAAQFAKTPVLDVKALKAEFAAIGKAFSVGEKVGVARVLSTFGEEALAKSFLEMEGTKIFKLTPEAIEEAFSGNKVLIDQLKATYFGKGAKTTWSKGFTVKGKAFIRPDSYASVAETVSHELPHVLQQKYEQGYASTIFYFTEHQAFAKQQQFLRNARANLGDAAFAEAFGKEHWLVDATDDVITKYIDKEYSRLYGKAAQPPAHIPVDRGELDAQLQTLLNKEELKRQQYNKVASQLDAR